MFDLKWIWVLVFGLLVLPVIPALGQAEDLATAHAVCLIGEHPGIPESDAQAAAMLVCTALRTEGIAVSDPVYEVPTSGSVYRVTLGRLGEKIFVGLSHENPIGTVVRTRQIMLANIEEMIPAVPRLVEALVHNKSIDATVDMENVTEQEARELRKISDESLWYIEVFGAFIPGTNRPIEPGFAIGWSYERPSYAVDIKFRRIGSIYDRSNDDNDDEERIFFSDKEFSFLAGSIGGRYFFNKRNISPYVGGGLAFVRTSYEKTLTKTLTYRKHWIGGELVSQPYDYIKPESDSGIGVYGIFGIELFRLTQSRLNLELRVDRPLFKLPNQDIMPITFGISFSRNFDAGGSCCLF